MFKLGKRVKVNGHIEDETWYRDFEEPGVLSFRNQVGVVVGHVTDDCGATPDDPLHIVWVKGKGKDGFWSQELTAA
jgi:hypothetical protein